MVTARAPLPSLESQITIVPQLLPADAVQLVGAHGSGHPEPVRDYDTIHERAISFHKKGDFRKAIVCYTGAIELDPQIADAYINRGAAYECTGDLDLAFQDLDTALALELKSEAYNNRGNVHFKKRDYDRAIQDYTKAIELQPGNAGTYIYRGHSFRYLAFYGHATRDYNEALALNPGNADAYVGIGIVHFLRGDHDKAIKNYDQALKIDSSDPDTYLNRGASHNAIGDLDGAEEDFGKALELDPQYAYAYRARALLFIKKGDFDRALRDLDRALQLNPDFADAQAVRGSLYLEKGKLDRAIRDLDKVLALDSKSTNAYNDRGVAYERKGDSARAMQDYDHALRIRPNQVAYTNRGIALLRLSQWDKARSDLLSARNMGMDIVSVFHAGHGDVAAFEEKHSLKLPQDIADMLTLEEVPQPAPTGESILDMFKRLRESVPPDTWDELPTDLVKNKKHYLYGHPKETE